MDSQGDAFVGLDADDEDVGAGVCIDGVEEDAGRAFEMDGDFAAVFWHAFADAHVERDSGPAPVVDLEFHCDVGLGLRLGVDPFFVSVAEDGFTEHVTGDVLAADDV